MESIYLIVKNMASPIIVSSVSSYLAIHDLNLESHLPSPDGCSTSLVVYFFHEKVGFSALKLGMQTCTLICNTGSSENSGDPSLLMVWMHAPNDQLRENYIQG